MQSSENIVRRHVLLIVIGYVIIVAMLGITSKLGIDNLNDLNERLRNVVQQNNVKARHIDSMRDAIQSRMLYLHTAIHLSDPFEIEDIWELYSYKAGQFIISRDKLNQMSLTDEQKSQLSAQREILAKAQSFLDKVINAVREDDKKTARAFILKAQILNQQVVDDLQKMKETQQLIAETAVSDSAEAMQKARTRIVFLTIAIIIVALIILIVVVIIITRQGKKVSSLLHQLEQANVDLERKVEERTEELLKTRDENVRMGAELAVTHQLQQMILPPEHELEAVVDLSIAAKMSPAEEAGGDYYDVLQYNDQIIIGVGDVTGHGLESSVVMLMVQTAVRTLAVSGETDSVRFISALNKVIYDNLQRIDSYKNLTFILTHYKEGILTLCGQHEELLLIRKGSSEIERIDTINLGFPIGLEENIDAFLETHQVKLNPGDTVVLYTDGIPEAENASGTFYGVDRLCEQISKNIEQPVKVIHDQVIVDLHEHINEHTIFDDITLVVIRRNE